MICTSHFFNYFMTTCILINTIVLSLDRYPISKNEEKVLDYINSVSTFIFIVEMITKIFGLGLKTYLSDGMNLFDSLVCILSLVEFILSN